MSNKIAIIGIRGYPASFPGSGGIDAYVQTLIPKLVNQNKKLTLFIRSWAHPQSFNKSKYISIIKIPTINNKFLDTIIYSLLASTVVCFYHVNTVWFHAPGSAMFSFLPKLFGKNIHLTIHGLDWKRSKWGSLSKLILKFAEFLSIKFADKIFVVSPPLKKYISKQYSKSSQLMAIDIPIQTNISPQKISSLYDLSKGSFLLFLGRFVPEKRVDWLIHAYRKINQPKKPIKLVLAGQINKDQYCRLLIKLAKGDSNIIWANFVSGTIKSELLSNCKAFILPSSIEGFSVALAEAISHGKKCLVSNLKIHKQLTASSQNIVTFKQNSFKDFYQKLNKFV